MTIITKAKIKTGFEKGKEKLKKSSVFYVFANPSVGDIW